MSKRMGRPSSPFILRGEKLAFKDEAERKRYMQIPTRQRVLLVLNAVKCDECGEIMDVLADGYRICNFCS